MENNNHLEHLRRMSGDGGDYYIDTTAVTTEKFTHIIVGPDGATVTSCKIRGVDVTTDRNYDVLPAGYVMCAGGDDYFDEIELSAGNASGVRLKELPIIGIDSVAVADGITAEALTATVTFGNSGGRGSKRVLWRIKDSEGAIVADSEGEDVYYLLKGENITFTIAGTYPAVDTGYTFEISLNDGETWTASAAFDVTAE